MERFIDPMILETMGLGEKLLNSALVMILGMGVTFTVLVFLMFSIGLLRLPFQKRPAKAEAKPEPVAPSAPAAPEVVSADADDELMAVITAALAAAQDDNVIAVIAGAIAAMETPGRKLKIQSIRRLPEPMPSWAQSGLANNMKRI